MNERNDQTLISKWLVVIRLKRINSLHAFARICVLFKLFIQFALISNNIVGYVYNSHQTRLIRLYQKPNKCEHLKLKIISYFVTLFYVHKTENVIFLFRWRWIILKVVQCYLKNVVDLDLLIFLSFTLFFFLLFLSITLCLF